MEKGKKRVRAAFLSADARDGRGPRSMRRRTGDAGRRGSAGGSGTYGRSSIQHEPTRRGVGTLHQYTTTQSWRALPVRASLAALVPSDGCNRTRGSALEAC